MMKVSLHQSIYQAKTVKLCNHSPKTKSITVKIICPKEILVYNLQIPYTQ